jgi:uncharacterized protein YqeY
LRMGLKETMESDLKDALRSKDEPRKTTLRLAIAAIRNAEIDKRRELEESELIGIVAKEAKQRRESAEQFAKGGREDLVAREEHELEILLEYLPAQLTEQEIEARAREVIGEVGASGQAQIGDVMRILMPEMKGKADGQMVSGIVKALLAEGE